MTPATTLDAGLPSVPGADPLSPPPLTVPDIPPPDISINIPPIDLSGFPPIDLPGVGDVPGDPGAGLDSSVPQPPHPLAGRYAVRTVSYARQKAAIAGQSVDLVSKGVLLSVADVSAAGLVTEHLCLIELFNDQGLATWSSPAGTERVDESRVRLERQGDVFVRPREEDRTPVAWSNAARPSDCPADGGVHASGCTCVPGDGLPTQPRDCRVRDLDGDGQPGLKLSVGLERPVDPSMGEALFSAQVAGLKAIEWRLPVMAGARIVGTVSGDVEQAQLSVQGELADQLGQVLNAACPSETAHVELVRGDFDCAKLLAARKTDLDSYGIFDVKQDAKTPDVAVCPDPACTVDSDRDGTPDCKDACPKDAAKIAAGVCGCGVADVDANKDGVTDCLDSCPNDPAKTAPGLCGCGVPDTNRDGDAEPDCRDQCAADPAKIAPGVCGCGVPDTNRDGDSAPDCTDACDDDPRKVAPGVCGCGVPDVDSDDDGTMDCNDPCKDDPNKVQPGVCKCGVPDRDLNGDGTIDCSDECPNDPAKVVRGLCGCGVPDTDSDNDRTPDCRDQCPNEPTLTAPGPCGCRACPPPSPLLGTYAVRVMVYGKGRTGTDETSATLSKAIGYSVVTITEGSGGALTISEKGCATETVPQPQRGIVAYGWTTPEWNRPLPPATRTATLSADGSWRAVAPVGQLGYTASQCSAAGTPPSGWPSAWGSRCTCSATGATLPAYDTDREPYDCRLTDPDNDGRPAVSVVISSSPPPSTFALPQGSVTNAIGLLTSRGSSDWIIRPSSDGKHTGNVDDRSQSTIVGCMPISGISLVCGNLPDTAPRNVPCPAAVNKLQFTPVAASTTCDTVLAQRSTLFTVNDGPWPEDRAACPPP